MIVDSSRIDIRSQRARTRADKASRAVNCHDCIWLGLQSKMSASTSHHEGNHQTYSISDMAASSNRHGASIEMKSVPICSFCSLNRWEARHTRCTRILSEEMGKPVSFKMRYVNVGVRVWEVQILGEWGRRLDLWNCRIIAPPLEKWFTRRWWCRHRSGRARDHEELWYRLTNEKKQ